MVTDVPVVGDVPVVEGFVDLVEVGRGGFSRVFGAYQVAFDRRVALKVLNERLADDASVAAFERECQAMGGLSRHPFIVTVLASAFTSDYRPCIVMDLFDRGNYMQLVRRDGPLPLEELLSLSVRVGGALATAHQDGVIHGDVKPQNIFKSAFGYPALGDFGIATLRNRLVERAGVGLSPHFVAPELIETGAVGAAADQYSLGATMFTLATGRRPFESNSPRAPQQVLAEALEAPAPTLPETFPRDLRAALRRAMARAPQDRFPDLTAFAVVLANIEHRLGHRPTAIPIAGIDDDATITVYHDTLAALRQQTPTPPAPAAPPDGPDAPTIALGAPPPQQPPEEPSEPPEEPKPRRRRVLLVALALLLAAATTTALLLTRSPPPNPPQPPPLSPPGAEPSEPAAPEPPPSPVEDEPSTPSAEPPEPPSPVEDEPSTPPAEPPEPPSPVEDEPSTPPAEPPAAPRVQLDGGEGRLVGSWSAAEGSSAVERWEVDDGDLPGGPLPGDTAYQWDSVPPGTHTIEVRACNAAGCSPTVTRSASVTSTESASAAPEPIQPFIPAATNSTIGAGGGHSCGLRPDGSITCWGSGIGAQVPQPSGSFAAVSVGANHSCGLSADGSVNCWGTTTSGPVGWIAGSFVAVSAGTASSCAVRADGSITCWGMNALAYQMDAPSGRFAAVSPGFRLSCALRVDGSIICWNSRGEPSLDVPVGSYASVSAGGDHACGVRGDGIIACWGLNQYGQSDAPAGSFVAVSAGFDFSCALRADGSITCWGRNENGQLDVPAGSFVAVSAGVSHACGLHPDGSVTCWGSNEDGQLDVPAGSFVAVSAGVRMLVADGTNVCGAGARLAMLLSAQGFSMLPAVAADRTTNSSTVYYTAGHYADANVVASLVQVPSDRVLPLPASPPTNPHDAHLVIHVGSDHLAKSNC